MSQYFHVQLCSENVNVLEGMLKIVNPDLILISLIGAYDIDTSIFFILSDQYKKIPVLTIGTREESNTFFKYYEEDQFENLIRPVENTVIMEAICKRLDLDKKEIEEGITEKKETVDKKLLPPQVFVYFVLFHLNIHIPLIVQSTGLLDQYPSPAY